MDTSFVVMYTWTLLL